MSNIVLPDDTTLQNCLKLSLKLSKPIDTYFYRDSLVGNVKFLTSGGESYIYKNDLFSPFFITYIYYKDHQK